MIRKYKGTIKNIDRIIISDPSYDKNVTCRYEEKIKDNTSWNVEINISDSKLPYIYDNTMVDMRSIEFSILLKKPNLVNTKLNQYNILKSNEVEEKNRIYIGIDTACVAFGINEKAEEIENLRKEWQPQCALKTLSDEYFGEIEQGKINGQTSYINLWGYLDGDTGYSVDDLKEYIENQLKIVDLELEKEMNDKDLSTVIFKRQRCEPEIIQIEKNVEMYNELLNGIIQGVPFTKDTLLICDRDRKIKNSLIRNIKYGEDDCIEGNFFIVSKASTVKEFVSLEKRQIAECLDKIKQDSFKCYEEVYEKEDNEEIL